MSLCLLYKLVKFYKETYFEDDDVQKLIEDIIEDNLKKGEYKK